MPLLSAPRSQLLENLPFHIKRLRITHVGIVPSLIEATMGTVEEDGGTTDLALRYIASGGEKMSNTVSVNPCITGNNFKLPRVDPGEVGGPSPSSFGQFLWSKRSHDWMLRTVYGLKNI